MTQNDLERLLRVKLDIYPQPDSILRDICIYVSGGTLQIARITDQPWNDVNQPHGRTTHLTSGDLGQPAVHDWNRLQNIASNTNRKAN